MKAAETRAMENGLDEAIHFARMIWEIYEGKVNLKAPGQIEVEAVTDNKSLWKNEKCNPNIKNRRIQKQKQENKQENKKKKRKFIFISWEKI